MQHFVKYIFVYPKGYADPYRLAEDPDYRPGAEGRLEDQHIAIVSSIPEIGDCIDYPTIEDKPATWKIVEIQPYVAQNSDVTLHVVICTQEGDIPKRRDWGDSAEKVMTFEADDVLQVKPDMTVPFSFGDMNSTWRNPAEFEAFKSKALLFVPENGRPIQGFDLIAIVKSNAVLAA